MIRLLLLLLSLMLPFTASAAIVTNTGSTGEDSITVAVMSLDSLGNPTDADSFFVAIFRAGANDAVFVDSGTTAMTGLDTTITPGGITQYYWRRAVADIDGPGLAGPYEGIVYALKNSPRLVTPNRFRFQVVSWRMNAVGDSAGIAARTGLAALDSLARVIDSLNASLDTLQNQDNWIANQTEVAGLDGWQPITDNDSLIIDQSTTSAMDSVSVARWVWNTPQANHNLPATFGSYLDTDISELGAGSGTHAVTVVAIDSTSAQVIPYASITVRNLEQTALLAVARTNAAGLAEVFLDPGDYVLLAQASGYLFAPTDTVTTTGTDTVAVYGALFNPGGPPSADLCRVYGWLQDLSGTPIEDAIVAAALPRGSARSGSIIVSPTRVTTATDSTGYFSLDLVPSPLFTGDDTTYEISIILSDGTIVRRRLDVPDLPSWQLIW